MKKIILSFFCVAMLSTSAVAQKKATPIVKSTAPTSQITAQLVIDEYLTALGGKAKLEAVKTTITDNTLSVQGMEVVMTTKRMGNKFKSVQSVMGQEIVSAFDGEKGYMSKMGTKTDIPADKIASLKKGKTMDALGYDAASFKTVTVEKLNDKDYNVLTSDKGSFYFDAATGLLYQSKSAEGNAVITSYLTVDGIKVPEVIEAEGNGQKITIKTTKVIINSGVSDADFN